MPLDLQRITKKAISESVAEQLRLQILRGEVKPGERLPPERELAPAFGTNRNTLREAIRSLETQGLVTVRQGDGVRVADFRTSGALSLLPDLLRISSGEERKRLVPTGTSCTECSDRACCNSGGSSGTRRGPRCQVGASRH